MTTKPTAAPAAPSHGARSGVLDGRILVMGCGLAHWRTPPDKFIETAQRVLAWGIGAYSSGSAEGRTRRPASPWRTPRGSAAS
jgi:hypothetical protein